MSIRHASLPNNREVEAFADDFHITGTLVWDNLNGCFSLEEVYVGQQGKLLLVDDPEKLGARQKDGTWKSFAQLLVEAA